MCNCDWQEDPGSITIFIGKLLENFILQKLQFIVLMAPVDLPRANYFINHKS
jgi:hypothetical protein